MLRPNRIHRVLLMTISASVAIVGAIVSPGVAQAAVSPLADPVIGCPAVPTPSYPLTDVGNTYPFSPWTDFSVTTHNGYWSIVATRGTAHLDENVSLLQTTTCGPTSANTDPLATDWVAVDNNSGRQPVGSLVARFGGYRDPGSSDGPTVQFIDGHNTLSTSSPYTYQPVGFSGGYGWLIDIRDVYLAGGSTATFAISGDISAIHLVGSNAASRSTWFRTPTSTVGSRYFPVPPADQQAASLVVTAPWSGWFGVVIEHRVANTSPAWVNVTVA